MRLPLGFLVIDNRKSVKGILNINNISRLVFWHGLRHRMDYIIYRMKYKAS